MEKDFKFIPDEIDNILCLGEYVDEADSSYVVYNYKINKEIEYPVEIHYNKEGKRDFTNTIIDDSREFVNGYKTVQVETGEYAYFEEKSNELLPYRFDIAGDFNEYGLAMVARDGKTTWMNKDFNLLDLGGNEITYEEAINNNVIAGFQEVSAFSKGEKPLSRVFENRQVYNKYTAYASYGFSYFTPKGEIKEFHEFDGDELDNRGVKRFLIGRGADFDENGRAMCEGYILFDRGAFVPNEELRHVVVRSKVLDSFTNIVNDTYDESIEKGKIARKNKF